MTIPTRTPINEIPLSTGLSQDDLIALTRHIIEDRIAEVPNDPL